MSTSASLLSEIQERIRLRDYRLTLHAADRSIQRHISASEIEEAVLRNGAKIIEDYPDDPRGPSCLILGLTESAVPLHVQCTYPPTVAIVTAYEPKPEDWINWRIRT